MALQCLVSHERGTQHRRAGANHLGVAAEGEADRVRTVLAERITRRAADSVRRELRRQLVSATHAQALIERRIYLGPDIECAARREGTKARDAVERGQQ